MYFFIIDKFLLLCNVSVSECSDENMMDAFNLAICFGPTLMPVPVDRDQVFCQVYVNELIKNIIVHYETVFPFDGGVIYERIIVPGEGYVFAISLLNHITLYNILLLCCDCVVTSVL